MKDYSVTILKTNEMDKKDFDWFINFMVDKLIEKLKAKGEVIENANKKEVI